MVYIWEERGGGGTSDGFANEGMAVVGMGGSVYTIKSAFATSRPAAAARRRRAFFRYIVNECGALQCS